MRDLAGDLVAPGEVGDHGVQLLLLLLDLLDLIADVLVLRLRDGLPRAGAKFSSLVCGAESFFAGKLKLG
jgi:hypothetical protein